MLVCVGIHVFPCVFGSLGVSRLLPTVREHQVCAAVSLRVRRAEGELHQIWPAASYGAWDALKLCPCNMT